MEIGIAGLGRMGAGMARRLARAGHDVVAWNRTESVAVALAAERENAGRVIVAEPLDTLAKVMRGPRHVIISVPAGDATDALIDDLAAILEPSDVIVDAGNSNFHDSQRRAAAMEARGLDFLDMGVSGGVWGLKLGFCAMLGGKREVFDSFEPIVRDLASLQGRGRRALRLHLADPTRGLERVEAMINRALGRADTGITGADTTKGTRGG